MYANVFYLFWDFDVQYYFLNGNDCSTLMLNYDCFNI